MKKGKVIPIIFAAVLVSAIPVYDSGSAETNIVCGDVNGDGFVTSVDSSIILMDYASVSVGAGSALSSYQQEAADVNKDGKANTADASLILRYYAYCSVNNDEVPLEVFVSQINEGRYQTASFLFPQNVDIATIPPFTDKAYVVLNNNIPTFDPSDYDGKSFESYYRVDHLGRCGVCSAAVGTETMPSEKRGEIGMIKPSGWHLDKYDFIDGKYLYNRCHLIGYQLTGENANPYNLVTGTRYLNTKGMLTFEERIASYVKKTNDHVLYRVTPVFSGDELVCRGLTLEGWSVEDSGASVCFNVFCYNVQPGVIIDYATGDNYADESYTVTAGTTVTSTAVSTTVTTAAATVIQSQYDYVANSNSKIFHRPECPSVGKMSEKNKQYFTGSREELIADGYKPCSNCEP